jgi:hypothetical protein
MQMTGYRQQDEHEQYDDESLVHSDGSFVAKRNGAGGLLDATRLPRTEHRPYAWTPARDA